MFLLNVSIKSINAVVPPKTIIFKSKVSHLSCLALEQLTVHIYLTYYTCV